jgi:hypothetical protein
VKTPPSTPLFLADRLPAQELKAQHPGIYKDLESQSIGKIGDTIQFCGFAHATQFTSLTFLPLKSISNDSSDLESARLTMRVLARYGEDAVKRPGISNDQKGNTDWLTSIKTLADDFLENGIYFERARLPSHTAGKPNWKKTIARERPIHSSNGNIVYSKIHTTRLADSRDNILAQVQTAILNEIVSVHGWWLNGLENRMLELGSFSLPLLKRSYWASALTSLLPTLFSRRAINLASTLLSYLSNDHGRASGTFFFGVNDFHTIWEHMLREVLDRVEPNWNSALAKPVYIDSAGGAPDQKGMRTDIVVRNKTKLIIVDAKYYEATSSGTSPGWGDIVKQLFYQLAVEAVESNNGTKTSVANCFVFPSSEDSVGRFTKIEMQYGDGAIENKFPEVDCFYVSIEKVMKAYLSKSKISVAGIHS